MTSDIAAVSMNEGRKDDRRVLRWPASPVHVVSGAVVFTSLAWRVWLLQVRYFDPDEFTHLHSAWSLVHGLVPYRDFFETHPPALYFMLAPAFGLFNVDTPSGAGSMLFFARWLMLAFSGLILLETFWLGRRWRDARVGAVGAAFLVTTFVFQQKTLEVRPDVPATALLLGCLLMAIGPAAGSRARIQSLAARMLLSGALMSLAILFTTKAVFAVPGLGLAIVLSARNAERRDLRLALRTTGWFAAGCALPILITCLYFLVRGGLGPLVTDLVVIPLRWKARIPLLPHILRLIRENSVLVVLGAIGVIGILQGLVRKRRSERSSVSLALTALTLIGGLVISPATFYQYYVLFLPLLALFAAWVVVIVADRIANGDKRERVPAANTLVAASAVVLAFLTWVPFHSASFLSSLVSNAVAWRDLNEFALLVTVALVVLWLSARLGALRGVALGAALAVLAVVPVAREIAWALDYGDNRAQLAAIEYVAGASTASDAVLDGFSGAGAFRHQVFYYGFLPGDIQVMVPEQDRATLLLDLRSGRVAPKIVVLDEALRGFLGPTGVSLIRQHYGSTEVDPLLLRRE